MQRVRKYFILLILSYRLKMELMACAGLVGRTTEKSSIFSPKIQLGPNWQQSTTKMAVAGLRCNADIFRSISYH